jgi:hypothetical protein
MTPRPPSGDRDTSSHILDIAERLVQNRGFNGFSYADIASALEISTTTFRAKRSWAWHSSSDMSNDSSRHWGDAQDAPSRLEQQPIRRCLARAANVTCRGSGHS